MKANIREAKKLTAWLSPFGIIWDFSLLFHRALRVQLLKMSLSSDSLPSASENCIRGVSRVFLRSPFSFSPLHAPSACARLWLFFRDSSSCWLFLQVSLDSSVPFNLQKDVQAQPQPYPVSSAGLATNFHESTW